MMGWIEWMYIVGAASLLLFFFWIFIKGIRIHWWCNVDSQSIKVHVKVLWIRWSLFQLLRGITWSGLLLQIADVLLGPNISKETNTNSRLPLFRRFIHYATILDWSYLKCQMNVGFEDLMTSTRMFGITHALGGMLCSLLPFPVHLQVNSYRYHRPWEFRAEGMLRLHPWHTMVELFRWVIQRWIPIKRRHVHDNRTSDSRINENSHGKYQANG